MPRRSLLAVLLVIAPVAAAARADDFELEEGFVSLFDGRDFSGWQFSGGGYGLPDPLPANWSVADGVVKLAGGGSLHLGTQWDYGDFEMRFEWRALRDKYNSGFFIRSGRKVGGNQINLASGSEGRFFGGKMNGGPAVPQLQKPAGEWNEWRVRCVGDKVTFWCNGELAWEGTEFASLRGHIGLQAEGAPLEFRRLRIRELDSQSLTHADGWKSTSDWTPDGDALASSAAGGTLESQKAYGDAVLRLEWKGVAPIVHVSKSQAVDLSKELAEQRNPEGQWNYLEVTRRGEKLTAWVNGKSLESKATPGEAPLVLEATGPLAIRNVRVRALEAAK